MREVQAESLKVGQQHGSKLNNTFHAGTNMFQSVGESLATGKCVVYGVTDDNTKATDTGEEAISVTFPAGGTLYGNGTNTWELTLSAEGWVYNDQVIIPTTVGYGVIIELE